MSLATGAPADPLISRAREREKAGDAHSAAELLGGWLEVNPGAAGSPHVFSMYFQLEEDYPSLLAAGMRFTASAKGVAGAGEQCARIARLLDVSGRIEEARNLYVAAWEAGASPSALISAFLLSVEMNDTHAMELDLERLKGRGGDAELLLGALADLRGGRESTARSTLIGLSNQTGNPELAVRALWVLYEYSMDRGDAAGQASARKKLAARFPEAPETVIASSAGSPRAASVFLTPRPGALDGTARDGDTAASGAGAAATPSKAPDAGETTAAVQGSFSVQAGSFQMKENADDLALELKKKGFPAVARRDTVNGKDRYRVFAGTGMDADAAKALLAALVKEGYSGFIAAETR